MSPRRKMKEPKRAWRPDLGSEVGKCDSPDANSIGLQVKTQVVGISAMDCPRFNFCNCPICPLDANWQAQKHLPGEPVCRWLREAVKTFGEHVLRRSLPEKSAVRVVGIANLLISRKGPLKLRLERAASQRSKSQVKAPWQRSDNGPKP